ncbi:hypothetical protein N7471_009094 [Penicillium samsonianum]|uniref:uncharacterized protein n=1 Tax=Penicillium samsonianum TaxID=1882272 RepID=UPI002546F387|nr:uncharacterized protein N7471_009094 [Penicillium samsonianum]KAJ6127877.1 hypothetical protein N7471_009094 [Penicillium samsonianum]
MYEDVNTSRDYVSPEQEDEERSSFKLSEEDGFLSDRKVDRSQQPCSSFLWREWRGYVLFSVIWIVLLLISVVLSRYTVTEAKVSIANVLPTELQPLQSVLKTEKIRFSGRLVYDDNGTLVQEYWDPDSPKYTGEPSDELDQRWDDLFSDDGVDLRGDEADTIRDQTFEKPGGWSTVGIDVFHQIHCLNMLRKGLRRDYYTKHDKEETYTIHLNHCLDYLRQVVMCNVDVTPRPVHWDNNKNRPISEFEVEHTCRDFWSVREWARERSGHKHKFKADGSV